MAASYQFKVGDICVATIRESKDVSKKVVVKVQKVSGEKCEVKPEDKDTTYFVQLNDLQPMHFELNDYRSLPGYYNKSENEQEFHIQQKKRKNRRGRDEERKTNEFQNTTNKSRGGMHNNENRNRGRNNNNRRVVSPTKPQPKENIPSKKAEKQVPSEPSNGPDVVNGNGTNSGNEESVPKVAKHAETSAAFWGRMRSNPAPTTPVTTPDSQDPSDNIDTSKNYNDSNKQESISGPTKESTADIPAAKHKNSNKNSNDISQLAEKVTKDTDSTNSSKGSNGKQNENLPSNDTQQKYILTTQASAKVNKVRENILMTSAKIESNTTVQDSQQTTATTTTGTAPLDKESKIEPLNHREKEAVTSPKNKTIQNTSEPKTSPKLKDQTPDLSPTTTNTKKVNNTKNEQVNKVVNEPVVKPAETSLTTKMEQMELKGKEVSTKAPIIVTEKSTTINSKPILEKPGICIKAPKLGKIKKKVSFGTTIEFFEKEPQAPVIQSPVTSQETQIPPPGVSTTTGERGKIHIPRDHIEKHMNQTYQQSNIQQHQQYVTSSDSGLTEQIQQQQSVRLIPQQSSYTHSPIANTIPTYYHQTTASGMYPIVYRQDPNMDYRTNYQLSQDPEAKDLPEGTQCVENYFYSHNLSKRI